MGVPSCGLCWLHNSGVSTPSVFSQSKNTLGLTLNQLEISFPRPNLNAIFSLSLSPHPIYTQTHTSPEPFAFLTGWMLSINVARSAAVKSSWKNIAEPVLFFIALLILWEILVEVIRVPSFILPPPGDLW